jgi:hypothetical protein
MPGNPKPSSSESVILFQAIPILSHDAILTALETYRIQR